MYNFLDPKLIPKVSCSSPSTDNYEPSNLISDKEAIRARGFLAYTVTKPPVEVEFEFLCPVNISYIVLETTVGTQKCTGIELFAKNPSTPYTSVAKAVYNKPGLIICNSKKYSKAKPPPKYDSSKELCFFKRDQFRLLLEVTDLKVVIFRTQRSVPCLGSVKVFGDPARVCSAVTVNTIKKIMGHARPLETKTDTPKEGEDLKIPKDFQDDLTCEIMAIPMTLPSGHTIDRDTLEKHIDNEKAFGRKPGDPFTGLKFTDTRKPVMNMPLKSRIDMFLLQNSNHPITYGLKRALGSSGSGTSGKKVKMGDENTQVKCAVCDEQEVLYVIPCKHFYCRQCLLHMEVMKCAKCDKEFSRNEPQRYHD